MLDKIALTLLIIGGLNWGSMAAVKTALSAALSISWWRWLPSGVFRCCSATRKKPLSATDTNSAGSNRISKKAPAGALSRLWKRSSFNALSTAGKKFPVKQKTHPQKHRLARMRLFF